MILFPEWPTPRELRRMTPGGRARWGTLAVLQTVGMLLAGLVLFL